MKYSVNGRQPENNFLWDKSTILSTVSIWEINYGRSNITVHLMSTKDLVLNLLNSGKHSGSFNEFSNETAEKLPISSTNLDIIEKELMRSTKSYHALNKHRYIMDFWINPR